MIGRRYNPKKHRVDLMLLLDSRGMNSDLTNDVPKHGIVIINENAIIAAGFLRKMEGNYALLDSYITDSNVASYLRDQALDLLTEELIKLGKKKKLKLFAFSQIRSIVYRAKRHGFKDIGAEMMMYYEKEV